VSYANNPSNFTFTGFNAGVNSLATSAKIVFQVGSLSMTGTTSLDYFALAALGSYSSSFEVLGDLVADKASILQALSSASLQIGGQLLSTNCLSTYAIIAQAPVNITANDFIFIEPTYAVLYIHNIAQSVNVQVTRDLVLTRTSSLPTGTPAIQADGAMTNIVVGSNFLIQGFQRNIGGSGLLLRNSASVAISAVSIAFVKNTSPSGVGAAINLASTSSLSLTATGSLLFQDNVAVNGGAIYSIASAHLSVNSPNITFAGNSASYGPALTVPVAQAAKFANASFINNVGTHTCVISFMEAICAAQFNTSGYVHGNTIGVSMGSSSCVQNEYLCVDSPTSPPVAVPPSTPCTTSAPSSGDWTCSNGQWVSTGSVSSGSVTIPSTSVVVKGNLTISGQITFTGLDSSISVEGGCAYVDGSVQVELTPSELEQISKESGSSRSVVLVSQSSNCTTNLALAVSSSKSSKSCRKVTSSAQEQNDGTRSSLVVIFKVDSSSCNTRWIILGCVLGGILLLVLILALVFTFNSKAKALIRPFTKRDQEVSSKDVN
jgi:predicted outer membrane repeat protein